MSLPSNLEKEAEKLVREMGFSRTEVNMALKDTNGNVGKAVEKLISGDYAPPSYTHCQQGSAPYKPGGGNKQEPEHDDTGTGLYPSMTNFISGLTNRKNPPIVETDPTAPPLFVDMGGSDAPDFSKMEYMPPPYQKVVKENKIKDWEVTMNVIHLNKNKVSNSDFTPLPTKDERCPVCFNAVQGAGYASGSQQDIVSHNGKIFHNSCFQRKHGPKCAYCFFPLGQADKDHELSGQYLVYKSKDYHVECYEKYAGPRCTSCFNVIIEKPNGEFSGNWVVDNNHEYHMECLQKKLYTQWRAKHS